MSLDPNAPSLFTLKNSDLFEVYSEKNLFKTSFQTMVNALPPFLDLAVFPLVNVKAYGAIGNGVADDIIAIENAISAARSASGNGGIVFFPEGVYLISRPIVLPRTNNTPTNVPHLIGTNRFFSTIRGSNNFPENRALIEWESVSEKPALEQRIAHLHLWLPNVNGVMAVNFKPTTKANYSAVFLERLMIELEDIYITAHNDYHEKLIYLEGACWFSKINRIYGDPVLGNGTYYTRLLEFDIEVDSGTTFNSDAPGFCLSEASHLYPMIRQGGYVQAFKGRCVNSTFTHSFVNGAPGGVYWDFHNSTNTKLNMVSSEGGGGVFVRFTNCDVCIAEDIAVGWPHNAEQSSNGIELINSRACFFNRRQTIAANAPYSTFGNKKIIYIDEDCKQIKFNDWLIKPNVGGISAEIQIDGDETNIVNYINVNDYTSGTITGT